MNNYTLIKAGKEHLQTIHDMAEVAFRHTYREMLSLEQIDYMMEWMYSLPSLEQQLESGHVYYIALQGDEPCGYISVQYEGDVEGKAMFHLHKIYILPNWQGKGLGRILFEKALDFARTHAQGKPLAIELNMNRENPALHFYQHMGLKILRQGDFHIGNGYYMNDYILEYSED